MMRLSVGPALLLLMMMVMMPALPAYGRSGSLDAMRFYQGQTVYIDNPDGGTFDVSLEVRDWNVLESGPREVLVKVYGPDGGTLVREVIADDGASGRPLMEAGGWDHEMWYYARLYGTGSKPMMAWSSFTDRGRLHAMAARQFTYEVPASGKGIYRVLIMGSRDHVIDMSLSRPMKYGVAGIPLWLHGHGEASTKYVYVPRGTTGLNVGFAEFDLPVTRSYRIAGPGGEVLWEGAAEGGFAQQRINFEDASVYEDKLLTVEVSGGGDDDAGAAGEGDQAGATGEAGDYMVHIQLRRGSDTRGGGVPALFCDDQATAKALRGGAIYHDGEVFWHQFQVRLHEWVKVQNADAFVVRTPEGLPAQLVEGQVFGRGSRGAMEYAGLPKREGYYTLNGPHEAPPFSDRLMHHYPAHKDAGALNLSIRDLSEGLRMMVLGDQVRPNGWNGNMGYVFATYGWHYWRPAWRIAQADQTPAAVKEAVVEAFIMAGDRLAFSRGIERVNGNAFSHIPMALKYAAACTEDELLTELADTYLERFASGGWGQGAGISPSGDCQEHFAHDYHYGTYILANYRPIVEDMGAEAARFKEIRDGVYEVYRHLYCPDANAWVYGSRTGHAAGQVVAKEDYYGQPGEDFTRSVGDGGEWFAARRANYYVLSFHGRLAPMWLNHYFDTRIGYGGGAICQLRVPGHGTVIASSQHGDYGQGMQVGKWPTFRMHSIVGTLADGRPVVGADSEHKNSRLAGNVVTSSGEVREVPVHAHREYVYESDHVAVKAWLSDTNLRAAYWNQGPSSKLREAWEMIPFVARHGGAVTKVTAVDASGAVLGELGAEPVEAAAVVIDCVGYGVRVELDRPRLVHRGEADTVMVELVGKPAAVEAASVAYVLRPFVGE